MTLSEAIGLFLTSRIADGQSEKTVSWYRWILRGFLAFVGDTTLDSVSVADLRRFLAYLRQKDKLFEDNPHRPTIGGALSDHTLAGYVRTLKAFYNFLESDGYITSQENIGAKLKRSRLPQVAPKAAATADIRRLLEVVFEDRRSDNLAKRDYALLLFLIDTGCRVGGLVGLRLSDLDLGDNSALVVEKGQKARNVFFCDLTKEALAEWLQVRNSPSEYVFVGQRGPLTRSGVSQILARLKKKAGIVGRINPHSFRHHFAKLYLIRGGDLASLSDIMGHADLDVTKSSYSVFLKGELQAKHRQYSPLLALNCGN